MSFLHDILKKIWDNSVFYVFRDTLYKVRKKCEKIAFFELFAQCPAKSVRKQCFLCFSRHFVQSSQKMRKTAFFWAFCTMSCKKCEKTEFFHVFRDTLYKVRRKCEKQRFLSFLHDVLKKVWENSVFLRFSRHFVQSS